MRAFVKRFAGVCLTLGLFLSPTSQAMAAHLPFDPITKRAALSDTSPIRGDLNGDGQADEIWFSHNGKDRLNLHVRFAGDVFGEDHIVTGLDAAQVHQLQVTPAGEYRVDCGDFASACDQPVISTRHDGLILSLEDGISVLIHWNGGHFEQDFVASNDLRLRLAIAMLFVLNP